MEKNNVEFGLLEDTVRLRKSSAEKRTKPLWNSFRDPEPERPSGSTANWNKFIVWLKILKIIVYITVFTIILITCIISKNTMVLMTAQLTKGNFVKYCDIRHPNREVYALIPEKQRIAWFWALIFCFSAPEVFSFLRVSRICFFKNIRIPTMPEILAVGLMEIFHVFGLALLTFSILPNLNSAKALMLTNCVCFIPSIFGLLTGIGFNWKSLLLFIVSFFALCAQLTGFIVWPLMDNINELWMTPLALILISCRWWENYLSGLPNKYRIDISLLECRQRLTESRSYIYLFLSPLKVVAFTLMAFLIDGRNITVYFEYFAAGWTEHKVTLKEKSPIYTDSNQNNSAIEYDIFTTSSQRAHILIVVANILSSYLCYICSKFACKIKIQEFSFSFPLCIAGPLSLIILTIFSGLRESDVCFFHDYFPDYMAFKSLPIYNIFDYIINEYIYIWVAWWISQMWIVRHVWFPMNDKNASTEKLFIAPWYSSLLIDQCITMNRRRNDQEKFVEYMDSVTFVNPEDSEQNINKIDFRTTDHIPQLIVCATMWHEEEDEMMQFLKSIVRLDEDQCARRMAKKYLNGPYHDDEYYELEVNIFFDDAFITESKLCADPNNPPINKYVKTLVESLEVAISLVYNTKIYIKHATKIKTPYGARLVWVLPGRTKMIAHLKNNDKIRNKKRWSQVMYMYYLLGYRIMEMDALTPRKIVIAQNTFLLALDGDIDFQPEAVHLLIGRMKIDPDLGAACGRIHPVGQGPMVWYQVFEYAIGHWLQKATEHVIGCVLCSPGCFSLFRGRALMEDSVMKKYTAVPKIARHFVQYDQGEDRWLCTLLLKQKFRVEYSAASDAYTHSPENFNEFYIQRRRWIPSTIANILDLLSDAKSIVKNNNSISTPYILYQGMIMVGTILGPGTIFLMMVGSLGTVFYIDIWTSFLYNFVPVLIFMLMCYFAEQKYQLIAAFIISSLYCLVMMAVLIGIIIQVMQDGIMSPTSLFFLAVATQVVITGLLHPQESGALICGVIYFITIPSMYMLLLIYSVFNMNDVSWGTREKKPEADTVSENNKVQPKNKFRSFLNNFKPNREEEGSIDFSFAGLFRCMLCTHQKNADSQLVVISDQLMVLNNKLKDLELKLSGEILVMSDKEEIKIFNEDKIENEVVNVQLNCNYLTGWLDDPLLANFKLHNLPLHEKTFWIELIKEYLHPLVKTDDEKKEIREKLRTLRNIVVFAFVMINSLFVLIVFLLQIQKSYLHIRWPFNAKDTIEFTDTTFEVTIYREYMELDPIGCCFVLFFGSILAIQFVAMIAHRFATVSQILAATTLNWFCIPTHDSENDAAEELRGASLEIAKKLQRPRKIDEENSETEESDVPVRKNTLYKLHECRKVEDAIDWNDLQTNFERRFLKGKLKLQGIPISRKSVRLLETNRKSILTQLRTMSHINDSNVSN